MKPYKLLVKHDEKIVHAPSFDTMLELEAHRYLIIAKNDWNFPTKVILVPTRTEIVPAKQEVVQVVPEVLDDVGNVIDPEHIVVLEPAIAEHQVIRPEHEVKVLDVVFEVVDNTAMIADKEAKTVDREKKYQARLTNVKNIDWSKVDTIAELKTIVRVLVEDFLKEQD
jgi:hypothetical protein